MEIQPHAEETTIDEAQGAGAYGMLPIEALGQPEETASDLSATESVEPAVVSTQDEYELPANPTSADLLAYARHNLIKNGLPVSGNAGKTALRYNAEISPIGNRGKHAGGMGYVSTH